MRCETCPVAAGSPCLGDVEPIRFSIFCRWASAGDPVHLTHIVNRSAMAEAEPFQTMSVDVGPTPSAPSLLRKAANVARAVVEHALAGLPEVDEPTFQGRLAICHACPSGQYNAQDKTCAACGCVLSIKLRWADQACPAGHWQAEVL